MPQKLVYIHSIVPGSLADKCNKLKVGDEIVMVGNDLMVGLTWKVASDKINQLVGSFKIVAQRRETVVDKLNEKQEQGEMQQNNSLDSDSDDEVIEKIKLTATVLTSDNSQPPMVAAITAQQHSEDSSTNKVTTNIRAEQPVVTTNHMNDDDSITFTVKVRICIFLVICFSKVFCCVL